MRVLVRLFARYAEVAGVEEMELQVPEGAAARDVVRELRQSLPSGHLIPEEPLAAIDREHASLDDQIREGQELALLPPLAGG